MSTKLSPLSLPAHAADISFQQHLDKEIREYLRGSNTDIICLYGSDKPSLHLTNSIDAELDLSLLGGTFRVIDRDVNTALGENSEHKMRQPVDVFFRSILSKLSLYVFCYLLVLSSHLVNSDKVDEALSYRYLSATFSSCLSCLIWYSGEDYFTNPRNYGDIYIGPSFSPDAIFTYNHPKTLDVQDLEAAHNRARKAKSKDKAKGKGKGKGKGKTDTRSQSRSQSRKGREKHMDEVPPREATSSADSQPLSDAVWKVVGIGPQDAFYQASRAAMDHLAIILIILEHKKLSVAAMRRQIQHDARTCLVHLRCLGVVKPGDRLAIPCFGHANGTMHLFTAQWDQVTCSMLFVKSFDISYRRHLALLT